MDSSNLKKYGTQPSSITSSLLTSSRIIASPEAKFHIGPNKDEFTIHSGLVALQSSSMHNIMKQQKGRFERPILWKHVEVNTFIRFSAFAYTGDYDGPEPRRREIPAVVSQPRLLRKMIKLRLTNQGSGIRNSYDSYSWEMFLKRYPGHEFSPDDAVDSRTYSSLEVFLCHVRMFLFADRYRITELRDLAIRKLWIAMVNMTFTGNAIPDLTQLIKYVYNNTHKDNPAGQEIRSLVRRYFIIRLDRMWNHTELKDFAKNSELLNAIPLEGFH
ncbi:hypothetical protein CEP51_014792 [Fusarium floridanum]|uniref:BTB domain-containing protein n=1 Tax=Fusarium floridanum TaxID=1325733 RepID=A0A428PLZ8_9HYPO|nr:hypothetical protein CEP51_014792 [Fusarium floridanum]